MPYAAQLRTVLRNQLNDRQKVSRNLLSEAGCAGGVSIVKDYVHAIRPQPCPAFLKLAKSTRRGVGSYSKGSSKDPIRGVGPMTTGPSERGLERLTCTALTVATRRCARSTWACSSTGSRWTIMVCASARKGLKGKGSRFLPFNLGWNESFGPWMTDTALGLTYDGAAPDP